MNDIHAEADFELSAETDLRDLLYDFVRTPQMVQPGNYKITVTIMRQPDWAEDRPKGYG